MSGVGVKVRNLNDNTPRATVTDASGEYQLLNLRPGSYEIVGTKENFNNATIASVTLDARQQLRADLKLEVSGVTQELNVKASAAAINTENAIIGDTKNFKQAVQLPMNYRAGNDFPLSALVALPAFHHTYTANVPSR